MFNCFRFSCFSIIALVLLALIPPITLARSLTEASLLADTCTVCHGHDGQGSNKIPILKGEDAIDLSESLIGFRSGAERSTIMGRLVKTLTDNEIRLLADYFSKL